MHEKLTFILSQDELQHKTEYFDFAISFLAYMGCRRVSLFSHVICTMSEINLDDDDDDE